MDTEMKVDLNSIRKQAICSYDRICQRLNRSINKGEIRLDPDDIQADMDELRTALMVLICSYIPDDSDFRVLIDEVGKITCFNDNVAETGEAVGKEN